MFALIFDTALWADASLTKDEYVKADRLRLVKCAKCHKLHDPSEYSQETWDAWMVKMRKKARLSDEQYDLLTRYFASVRNEKK